jgi:hypothetical protein
MMDFSEFAEFLAGAAERVRPELEVAAGKIGEAEKKAATKMIGHELPFWTPLAEKARPGRDPANAGDHERTFLRSTIDAAGKRG